MKTKYSPLTLLTASHADRASVLLDYMVEDYAGREWDLDAGASDGDSPAGDPDARAGGLPLDEPTRSKLTVFALMAEVSRKQAERCYAEYWLVYTVLAAYAHPLHANGWGFLQLLLQLDSLTSRAQALLPRVRVPSFECVAASRNSVVIRLREEHRMAAPFLRGLLVRLAADFGVAVKLSERPEHGDSALCVEVLPSASDAHVRMNPVATVRRPKPVLFHSFAPRGGFSVSAN